MPTAEAKPSSHPARPARSRIPAWAPFLVLAAAWLAQGRALQNGWIRDDVPVVRDNAVVARGLGGIPDAFHEDAWRGPREGVGPWRPLTLVSYALEAPLWRNDAGRLQPFGFHLTNLLLHGFCALLLLLLVGRLFPGRPALAVGGALVFAVHPLATVAVSPITGRSVLLAAFFGLVMVWAWAGALRGRWALLPLSALAYFLALFSDEGAIAFPLLLPLIGVPSERGGSRSLARRFLLLPVFLVPLALFLFRHPGGEVAGIREGAEAATRAVLAFLVPVGLIRDRLEVAESGLAWGAGVGVLLFAAGVLLLLARRRRFGGIAGFVLAGVGLVSFGESLVSPAGRPIEAGSAYPLLVLLALLGGLACEALLGLAVAPAPSPGVPRRRLVGRVGVLLLLLAFGGLSWAEAGVWHDEDAWQASLMDRHPGSVPLMVEEARRLRLGSEASQAEAYGLPVSNPRVQALHQDAHDRLQAALGWAGAAADRAGGPQGPPSYWASAALSELGLARADSGQVHEAASALEASLARSPDVSGKRAAADIPPSHRHSLAVTYRTLARVQRSLDQGTKAAANLQKAVELDPDDPALLEEAAIAFLRDKQFPQALLLFVRAQNLAPTQKFRDRVTTQLYDAREQAHAEVTRLLRDAQQRENQNDLRGAIGAYEDALRVDPTVFRAYYQIATHEFVEYGEYDQAEKTIAAARGVLAGMGAPARKTWGPKFDELEKKLRQNKAEDEAKERQSGDEGGG